MVQGASDLERGEAAGVAGISHASPVDLSFQEVTYSIPPNTSVVAALAHCRKPTPDATPKQILHGISGYVEAGHCLAIMGPSGAGKSSLMDVLAGRRKRGDQTGDIRLNGLPLPDNFQRISGYVMQDDVLLGTLTVTETLMYSHALRMPASVHRRDGAATVASILQVLMQAGNVNLQILNLRKVANSRIGTPEKRGISGGERRRLNIGIELVTSPSLLFMDEPTSGLDARNALRVMRSILRLCRVTGRTVVCTIHQPRSNVYAMFDQLLLLDRGHTVYFGPAQQAVPYFASLGSPCPQFANPADFLLDLLEDVVEGDTVPSKAISKERMPSGVGSVNGGRADTSFHDEDEDDENDGADGCKAYGGRAASVHDHQPQTDGVLQSASPFDYPTIYRQSEIASSTISWILAHSRPTNQLGVEAVPSISRTSAAPLVDSISQASNAGAEQALLSNAGSNPYEEASLAPVSARGPASPSTTADSELANSKYAISSWRQLQVLTSRTWLATVRDPAVMWVRTVATLLIALLVGGIFFQQEDSAETAGDRINVLLFVMCVFSLFCLPAIGKFIEERVLFTREHASGYYSTFSYFMATFVVEFPILLAIVIMYGVITYWMVGLEPTFEAFCLFLLTIFLVINVGFSLSQLIAASVSSLSMAIAIYMIVLVYSLLTGGFIVSAASLPSALQWMLKTSYFFYGYEALCVIEFRDKDYGPEILDNLGFDADNLVRDISVLAGMFVMLRIAAYFVLAYLQREKR